jgi:heme-degrading monooxygenase HmoA
MIRHTAVFRLKHAAGSAAETAFLAAVRALKTIPGINAFEVLRQVSPKNDFTFGVSMEFADDAAYQGYNNHPAHVAFVRDRWLPEVVAFMEIDYVVLPGLLDSR